MMRGDVVRNGLDVYKKARWNFLQLQGRLDSNSRGGLSVELKSISRNGKIHYEECETVFTHRKVQQVLLEATKLMVHGHV